MTGVAFFDLDKTLLDINSAVAWISYELEAKRMRKRDALRAMMWITQYHLGFSRLEDAIRKTIAAERGADASILQQRTQDFWQRRVIQHLRNKGIAAIASHRDAGDKVVLLTSSTHFLAHIVQNHLDLDAALCTELEIENGKLTGFPVEPICYGEGKLKKAKKLLEVYGISLQACTFYTDSIADISVLKKVGAPRLVNPDQKLRRLAKKREWPIIDWTKTHD